MFRNRMLEERGQSLVELALIMPIFTVLLVGAADFARLAYAGIEVSNAARAGVQYGAQNRITALDISGMTHAATSDGPDVASMSATASNSCVCTSGATVTCANAATACVAPARTLQYVQVNTTAVVSPLFHYPGLPATFNLKGQATMRVEQ
ncbi:MAG: TadE/TadG family type IV pilus assembly protein [Terracidiphilus sp.]|nr:TadE/TadG family type IV pilus assembly protein [Terracidiphilus sp.]